MRRLIPGLLVLSLGIARASSADPVKLISGSNWLYGDGSLVTLNVSGRGAGGGGGGSVAGGAFGALGQNAGFSRFLSTAPLTPKAGSSTAPGTQVTAPIVVPNPSAPTAPTPGAPSVPQPPPSALNGAVQLFTAPNQMNGLFMQGGNSPGTSSGTSLAAGKLTGNGGQGLTLTAAAAPSATPEPASLLLLGTGLAAAFALQSRRFRGAV